MHRYHAIVSVDSPDGVHRRVSLLAESLGDAEKAVCCTSTERAKSLAYGANRKVRPSVKNSTPKRPRDPAQLAKLMIDIASGEVSEDQPTAKETRARKAGTKGGPARARALSPEQRSEIARAAATARWKKS